MLCAHRTLFRPAVLLLVVVAAVAGPVTNSHAATRVPSAATSTVTPTRYVHGVCVALNTWLEVTSTTPEQVRAIADDFSSGKLTAAHARSKTVAVTAKAKQASDKLVASTRAVGVPNIGDGPALAKEELSTVGDVAHVYQFIGKDLKNSINKVKDKELYSFLEFAASEALDELDWAGMPLQTLQDNPTLHPLVDQDPVCAKVLSAYTVSYEPSGLQTGDCV
jgi:hypothetical protein